jgi:hypothetical protein
MLEETWKNPGKPWKNLRKNLGKIFKKYWESPRKSWKNLRKILQKNLGEKLEKILGKL